MGIFKDLIEDVRNCRTCGMSLDQVRDTLDNYPIDLVTDAWDFLTEEMGIDGEFGTDCISPEEYDLAFPDLPF